MASFISPVDRAQHQRAKHPIKISQLHGSEAVLATKGPEHGQGAYPCVGRRRLEPEAAGAGLHKTQAKATKQLLQPRRG